MKATLGQWLKLLAKTSHHIIWSLSFIIEATFCPFQTLLLDLVRAKRSFRIAHLLHCCGSGGVPIRGNTTLRGVLVQVLAGDTQNRTDSQHLQHMFPIQPANHKVLQLKDVFLFLSLESTGIDMFSSGLALGSGMADCCKRHRTRRPSEDPAFGDEPVDMPRPQRGEVGVFQTWY